MNHKLKFQCAMCGEERETEETQDELVAKLGREYPGVSPDECDLICSKCNGIMTAFDHITGLITESVNAKNN